jgi:hypothetical protein
MIDEIFIPRLYQKKIILPEIGSFWGATYLILYILHLNSSNDESMSSKMWNTFIFSE